MVDPLRWLLLATAALCAFTPAQAGEGLVRYDMEGKAFLYTTERTAPAGPIQVQYPGRDGKARCCASATASGPALKQSGSPVTDEIKTEKVHMYRLEAPALKDAQAPFVGAAVFGNEPALKQISAAELAIGGAKGAARVLTCVSREGMHLLKESGGSLQAHLYLPFDYEVKPACSKKAMKLIKGG